MSLLIKIKKGKLLASLYETKGKTTENITNCKHLIDSRWKVKAILKVTGITLTEKYTSLKIKNWLKVYFELIILNLRLLIFWNKKH